MHYLCFLHETDFVTELQYTSVRVPQRGKTCLSNRKINGQVTVHYDFLEDGERKN
jgi:hypothetical protein